MESVERAAGGAPEKVEGKDATQKIEGKDATHDVWLKELEGQKRTDHSIFTSIPGNSVTTPQCWELQLR